ncbi:MAG: hypothetical protein ACI9PX_000969, partial [Reinekea sp.]
FLTPPFGFALFYLRGVAPKVVKTLDIYKGVVPFIGLQLLALLIVGLIPPLVNYLPNRIYLTSENAPPPLNPKLQQCLERNVFANYQRNEGDILAAIDTMARVDLSALPEDMQNALATALTESSGTFALVDSVNLASAVIDQASVAFGPLHIQVRGIESDIRKLRNEIKVHEDLIDEARFDTSISAADIAAAEASMAVLNADIMQLNADIPLSWEAKNAAYQILLSDLQKAQRAYRNHVDNAYRPIQEAIDLLANPESLASLAQKIERIDAIVLNNDVDTAMDLIKELSAEIGEVTGADQVGVLVNKARRALRGSAPDQAKALDFKDQALAQLAADLAWMRQANQQVLPGLKVLEQNLNDTIGVRLQPRLSEKLALSVAACQSVHEDVSLSF